MNGAFKHPLRVGARLLWLIGELMLAGIRFVVCVSCRSNDSGLHARAFWLQTGCRRVLRIFDVHTSATGTIPTRGLLVCNHLSYLDVLVLGAITPTTFVAKREVRSWPIFGWFARLAGTLFTDRQRPTQVGALTNELRGVLQKGGLVVLFPEGTSSDGRTVLPFKSALLEPATESAQPLCAGLIEYRLQDGDVGQEVCYWKDMSFVPHLFNLLSKRSVYAYVQFAQLRKASTNRKILANQLHDEVLRLRSVLVPAL